MPAAYPSQSTLFQTRSLITHGIAAIRHQRPRRLLRLHARPIHASLPSFHPPSKPHHTHTMATTGTAAAASSTVAPETTVKVAADISKVESAKRKAAYAAVAEHFDSAMPFVGIGSGSTIVYGVEAIKEHLAAHPPPQGHINWFVPTGYQSRKVIEAAGLNPLGFDSLPADAMLSVAFDGADEVDAELNCIKGGGACLFQEKLVALRAKKFVCIADYRKRQERLLSNWPTIPIEIAPFAEKPVLAALRALGSVKPFVREHAVSKSGPVQTDQNFYIVDAPFKQLLTKADVIAGQDGSGKDGVWEVETLARMVKSLPGVLEVGLFCGLNGFEAQAAGLVNQGGQKPVAVYFGMSDGEVSVLNYKE